MSDISTTLSMKGGLFSENELFTCSLFNLKMFLLVLLFLICTICILGCITPQPQNSCEGFSNDNFFSDVDAQNPGYSYYQSTPLTSDSSLIFGQANRYVYNLINTTTPSYILDIYADLYVLGGNPFGAVTTALDKPLPQQYVVYLKNTKTSTQIQIGNLKKDGDGLYKLHFVSNEPDKYITYNEVHITYKTPDNETPAINGKFTIV